jgi:GAF domain-containing protein
MLTTLRKLFTPPIFEDEEKTRAAQLLGRIILGAWIIPIVFAIVYVIIPVNRALLLRVELGLVFLLATITLIAYRGFTRAASLLLMTVLVALALYINYISAGEPRPAVIYYAWLIVASGLLLGGREALVVAALFSVAQIIITQLAIRGTLQVTLVSPTPLSGAIIFTTGYFLVAFTFRLALNSIQTAFNQLRKNDRELSISNKGLEELTRNLEEHVKERTAALEKRATQMQIVSSVARTIASVQDLNTLLPNITNLVSDQFGYYHVGIFLLDEHNEFALLRAANSEGGAAMLNRQHKLKLDTNSIVGYVASRGEPRVAVDVGADSVYFNNPDLPATRSEMALPLRVSNRVIGVLDVQSTKSNAFAEGDIATLTTLADQVAIAIENARLFSEARESLNESEETFTRYVKHEWENFANQAKNTGYIFDGNRTAPLDKKDKREKVKSLAQTGRLSLEKESTEITIPIRFRGQTIGILDVKSKRGNRQWTQDEITLLEAAAERTAFALENARLVESSQRRASRERAIGEISAKIGSVSELDAIMQTAVEELGRKIGSAAEVTLELSNEED